MSNNPVTSNELLAAIDALILSDSIVELQPEDITASRLAARLGSYNQRAMTLLKRWEAEGKIVFLGIRVTGDGHRVKAWKSK